MSRYLEIYQKRLLTKDTNIRTVRDEANKSTLNRNFALADGYREIAYWDRTHVDEGYQAPVEGDIIVRGGTNSYEKFMTFRPNTKLNIGTYVKYKDDRTFIIRELQTEEPMPTYRAFECNQILKLKGCPFAFPCFSYNSTYSSKGMIDIDRAYGLDSRNKIYIQKNVFSNRLLEYHRGYRIRLGDEEGWYTFTITEMDDLSYKGMYIVSLKIDVEHPLDGEGGAEYAHNDVPIDFSDLLHESDENEKPATADPILFSESYFKVGDTAEVVSSKTITAWDVDTAHLEVVQESETTLICTCISSGITSITATDNDGKTVTKNLVIK